MNWDKLLSAHDVERAARKRLPPAVFSYVQGGAEDAQTLAKNHKAFTDHAFLPRSLVNVTNRCAFVQIGSCRGECDARHH